MVLHSLTVIYPTFIQISNGNPEIVAMSSRAMSTPSSMTRTFSETEMCRTRPVTVTYAPPAFRSSGTKWRSGAIPAAVGVLNVAVRFFRVKIRTLGYWNNTIGPSIIRRIFQKKQKFLTFSHWLLVNERLYYLSNKEILKGLECQNDQSWTLGSRYDCYI